MYKAPDVQIDAVAQLVKEGLDVRLVLIGDGKHRAELEARAAAQGIAAAVVIFRGQLTAGSAVRAELDAADIFCMPSRTEGMPRALIEAMARGLPCIGSTMGGIPELLPAEDMVPPVMSRRSPMSSARSSPIRRGWRECPPATSHARRSTGRMRCALAAPLSTARSGNAPRHGQGRSLESL